MAAQDPNEKNPPDIKSKTFNTTIKKLYRRNKITDEAMMADGRPLLEETARSFEKAMHEGFSSINYQPDPVFTQKLTDDIWVFSGCKTYRQLKEVTALLVDENGKKKPWLDFKADVQSIYQNYNENYLKAEYKNVVSTSRMAASWKKWEKDADAYNLQYRTAGDSEVRESHKLLNRITLPMDDSFWNSYVTPLDWGCRCRIIRVLKERYEVSNSKEAAILANDATRGQEMFKFNPGKQAVVFPPAHPYYQLKEKVGKLVDGLLKEKQDTIAKNRKEYESFGNEYTRNYFDEDRGGYWVTHKKHDFDPKTGKFEKEAAMYMAKEGNRVELLSEGQEKGKKSPDAKLNGTICEIKANITPTPRAWKGYFESAKKKDAESLLIWVKSDITEAQIHEFTGRVQPKRYGVKEVIVVKDGEQIVIK